MTDIIIEGKESKELSVIKDPFVKDSVGDIIIHRVTGWGDVYWRARVKFTNGNTSGEQETPKCNTYEEVIIHLKQILDSVKNKQ